MFEWLTNSLSRLCDPVPWNVLHSVATSHHLKLDDYWLCSRNTYVFRCAWVFWIVPAQLSVIWSAFALTRDGRFATPKQLSPCPVLPVKKKSLRLCRVFHWTDAQMLVFVVVMFTAFNWHNCCWKSCPFKLHKTKRCFVHRMAFEAFVDVSSFMIMQLQKGHFFGVAKLPVPIMSSVWLFIPII